jgi:hypothetical protein
MAMPAGTFTTFRSIGQREDLADAIYDISPLDTPMLSSIPRVKATGITHEWQTDILAASEVSGAAEGGDFAANTAIPSVRLTNICHIFRKDVSVSRTQRVVQTAGRRDEYAYQLAKRGKELKRNIEKTLLGSQGKGANGSDTARLSGGLATYLHRTLVATNFSTATIAVMTGNGVSLTVASTYVASTPDVLKGLLDTVIGALWDAGSDANVILCNKTSKAAISLFSTGIATLYREVPQGAQGAIIGGVDLYVSNFGEFVVVPDRHMPTALGTNVKFNVLYLVDYEYLAFAELDPIDVIPVAKTGDADKAMIVCEGCLEVRSEHALGGVLGYQYSAR